MMCLFCRERVQTKSSPLDVSEVPPDMHEIACETCGLVYHIEGTLLATRPDLSKCADLIERIRTSQGRTRVALFSGPKGIEIREYPLS